MENGELQEHEKQARLLAAGESTPLMSEQERLVCAPLLAHARSLGARLTPALHDVADEADDDSTIRRAARQLDREGWDDQARWDAMGRR